METLSAVLRGVGRVLGWFIDRPKRILVLLVGIAILSPAIAIHVIGWSLGRLYDTAIPFLGLVLGAWIVWTFFLNVKPGKGKKK